LYDLNKLQRKYAQDAKPYNPTPSKNRKEAISNLNNYEEAE
jgi:hypothetical protein